MLRVNVWGNIAADAVRRDAEPGHSRPHRDSLSAFIPTFSPQLPSKRSGPGVNLISQSGDSDDQPDR